MPLKKKKTKSIWLPGMPSLNRTGIRYSEDKSTIWDVEFWNTGLAKSAQ